MSYANINGAQIYYDTYGSDPPAGPPVPLLLVHGAGSTGQADWREVAPLLARHYRVVVPDCRGHGRSTNPGWSYRFREMADDLAELIRRLGYARAHVVGHGNGGNVALVMLLENSEVVQTCTLQAANAYVSPDLLEGQVDQDPDWLAAEAPGWVRQMVALHAPMHGNEYWRELWQLRLAEAANQPDYTANDLALAARPVLVIQGEQDQVNVPGQHGQFLARHIPDVEAWFPRGAGHAVHREMPWQWTERLLEFLGRRGDEANEALDRLHRRYREGGRATVFEVRAQYLATNGAAPDYLLADEEGASPDEGELADSSVPEPESNGNLAHWRVRLTGEVLDARQCEAAVSAVAELIQIAGTAAALTIEDQVRILLRDSTPLALVDCPVVDVWQKPNPHSLRVSQALAGEPVRVVEEEDGWVRGFMLTDGTLGWLPAATLHPCSEFPAADCGGAGQFLVISQVAQAYAKPSRNSHLVGKLPCSVILPAVAYQSGWAALRFPGGTEWWVPGSDLLPLTKRPQPDLLGATSVLKWLVRWVGAPYLEGGRTPFGIDGPGLAQVYLHLLGVPVARSAEQQFHAGQPVEGLPRAGDLVFFAHEPAEEESWQWSGKQRISHVAISLGGYHLLQAGGGTLAVNQINLERPRNQAAAWLRDHLAGARRFVAD